MMSWFLKQLPEVVRENENACRKIKTNKNYIFDVALEEDDADVVGSLFSLYKKIKLDELNSYIEKAEKSVAIKAFLLDYKEKNYSVKKHEEHATDKIEKELGLKELTVADWKKTFVFEKNKLGDIIIKGYKGADSDVVVPDIIGKNKVVAIGEYAFSTSAQRISDAMEKKRENIASITLPDSVTSIGDGAFCGCVSLTTIVIPDGITSIGEDVFSDCISLTEITIPDSVTDICCGAFGGCSGLTSVTIPCSVTRIDYEAFAGCENLTSINVDDGNSAYSSVDGVLFNKTKDRVITCPRRDKEAYIIPDGVTSVGECAFSGLTSIVIPDSVISIEQTAFWGCPNIKIHAPAGSYAEQYAKENDIPFVVE